MERLAREKIATQQRLAELKNELSQWMDVIEIDRVLRQTVQPEEDQASTSTASGGLTVCLCIDIKHIFLSYVNPAKCPINHSTEPLFSKINAAKLQH